MKKKVIMISSFIIVLLSSLIIFYNKMPHYNMELDGVKLAVTLDGDEVSSFPKDSDYYVDITCSHVIGEYLYDETEETFKLTFKNIESGAKCKLDFTSNPDTLKDIVEDVGYLEEGIPTGYTKIGQSGYTGSAPTDSFYATSFGSSTTSGTADPDATLTFDTTNNMWVTGNLTASRYYYYFFNVTTAGTYQFCWSQSSGNNNRIYIYKGNTNLINTTYITVTNSSELCVGVGDLATTDVIKVVQYTNTTAANVSSMNFGFKESSTTTNAGYRYEGEDPNNYVWFNNELWRIIGSIPTKIDSGGSTTTTNLVKIIRENPIGDLVWNKTSTRPDWNASTLYTLLNSYYYGAQNATGNTYCYGYQSTAKAKCDYRYIGINPSGYYGTMIKEVYWNTGESQTKLNPMYGYADEASVQTMKGHVGIMNISDYGFATSYNRPSRTTMNSYNNANCTGNDWLYGKGTLTPNISNTNNAIYVSNYGNAGDYDVYRGYAARPVVYLDSSVYVASGDGSRLTPYKLGM